MSTSSNDSNNTLNPDAGKASIPTPTDKLQDSLPASESAADEMMRDMQESMIRLSTDEALRKKIGAMLV